MHQWVWIGNYVAAASFACFIAIALDTFLGFRKRTHWFPCKFFTRNAASLTLLAVAMKLPLDLSNSMEGTTDQLAKLSSTVFLCVVMCNFMPSLGVMDDKEILSNLAALGILVITVLVNVAIQLHTGAITHVLASVLVLESYPYFNASHLTAYNSNFALHIVVMISMIMLLVVLSVTALIVPTLRKILEVKYAKLHKVASNVEFKKIEMDTIEKLKENVGKYWMMAKTGNPQFVISRSATCFSSGTISLLVALLLVIQEFNFHFWVKKSSSNYKGSTFLISMVQTASSILVKR